MWADYTTLAASSQLFCAKYPTGTHKIGPPDERRPDYSFFGACRQSAGHFLQPFTNGAA